MVTVCYANDELCPVFRASEYLRGILFTTDLTDWTDQLLELLELLELLNLFLGVRQKPDKPLALDARCL